MLFKFLIAFFLGLFFLYSIDDNFAFAELFPVTIPLGATTSNIDEPFIPSTISVPVNSTISWTNNDSAIHTVTSTNETSDSRLFDSGLLSQGQSFEVTYNKTGVYPYQCILHPFMTGNVNVGINNTSASETASNASSVRNTIESKDQNMVEESPITLTAQEIDGAYVWEKEGKNNPTLNLLSGKQYDFAIKSLPTDPAEHEFKIVLPNGEDIVEAEEVEEGEQTTVSFTPATQGTLRYYCEYHPDSMVGIINIVGK